MECLAMNYYSIKKKNPNILAENLDEHFSISLYMQISLSKSGEHFSISLSKSGK